MGGCESCHVKGASEAKNLAASEIGRVLGIAIVGSTPTERFDYALMHVDAMKGLLTESAMREALRLRYGSGDSDSGSGNPPRRGPSRRPRAKKTSGVARVAKKKPRPQLKRKKR